MASLSFFDLSILAVLLLGGSVYLNRTWLKQKLNHPITTKVVSPASAAAKARDFLNAMDENDKNCVVFYGSQTGTAEEYAIKLAQEGAQRFGLRTLVADLADYDYDNLAAFPADRVAFFTLASHGEGEPTDNAFAFYTFITEMATQASDDDTQLSGLKFVVFGLGNSTYEQFNAVARNIDSALTKLGAQRLGHLGEGNDGTGTMEEDFLAWKEPMWEKVAEAMNLEEQNGAYQPMLSVSEETSLTVEDNKVFLGELGESIPDHGRKQGQYSAKNPFIAPVVKSSELFTSPDRNCIHMEISLGGSDLSYETGDHIAIWPSNSGIEVDRFLHVFGLYDQRDAVVEIDRLGSITKVPTPTPTTYDAIFRYYIEICAPVSRQFLSSLAEFAVNEDLKSRLISLGKDKDEFNKHIAAPKYNIAQAIQSLTEQPFTTVPPSLLLEKLRKLQPRYYSISSSSLVQSDTASITVIVESSCNKLNSTKRFYGTATNYLLALKMRQNNEDSVVGRNLQYQLDGPRGRYAGYNIPVYIRHSGFKLPKASTTPIIMVGPGTGVAPFRGFLQERAHLAKHGKKVGASVLFYGCRSSKEDFLYKDEWKATEAQLGTDFKLVTAFSREGSDKVYVQHRLLEHVSLVSELLAQGAYFYVCGNASGMAVDVRQTLSRILADMKPSLAVNGDQALKVLRQNGRYQEDVW